MTARIVILGEFAADRPSRMTIGPSLEYAAAHLGMTVDYEWLTNARLTSTAVRHAAGVFVAPGGPTEDLTSILEAIHVARTEQIPCLGTCGGFQRMVMEYAGNELGFTRMENSEVTPDAVDPFFAPLTCSLVGKTATVTFVSGMHVARIYGTTQAQENFFCGYGINPKYLEPLQSKALRVSAFDASGEPRVVELTGHPFFMATLYVPQVQSTATRPHPVITAFLQAARFRQQGTSPPDSIVRTVIHV